MNNQDDIFKLEPCILVDIDGTVAHNNGHRGHFEWEKIADDTPHEDMVFLIFHLVKSLGLKLIFVTGRMSTIQCAGDTAKWICKHFWGVHGGCQVLMRPEEDYRPDYEVKKEIYENHIKNRYKVLYVFDDRDSVVKMWRELGLRCLQVAPGDF